jgi:hypothetical protein
LTASYLLKLERADKHFQTLDDRVNRWLSKDRYRVTDELDPERGDHVVSLHPDETPECFSVLISDCIHNMRSALDNLAYDLAVAYTGERLTDRQRQKSEFPIFGDKPLSATNRNKKIGGVHPEAIKVICDLQPHLRPDNGYASDPLWVLHELENIDKHRTITTVLGQFQMMELPGPFKLVGVVINMGIGPLEGKTELMRYGSAIPLEPNGEVEIKPRATLDVAFPKASPANGELVRDTLTRIRKYIDAAVVAPLAGYAE